MENNGQENLPLPESLSNSIETVLLEKVTQLLPDLLYPSESDEPIEWFTFKTDLMPPLTVGDMKLFGGFPPDEHGKEISVSEFWGPLLTDSEESEEGEETTEEQLADSKKLKKTLKKLLHHPQAFRIGQVEVSLYLVGHLKDNEWGGLKTLLVETG